jgi:hypothetical protein
VNRCQGKFDSLISWRASPGECSGLDDRDKNQFQQPYQFSPPQQKRAASLPLVPVGSCKFTRQHGRESELRDFVARRGNALSAPPSSAARSGNSRGLGQDSRENPAPCLLCPEDPSSIQSNARYESDWAAESSAIFELVRNWPESSERGGRSLSAFQFSCYFSCPLGFVPNPLLEGDQPSNDAVILAQRGDHLSLSRNISRRGHLCSHLSLSPKILASLALNP